MEGHKVHIILLLSLQDDQFCSKVGKGARDAAPSEGVLVLLIY